MNNACIVHNDLMKAEHSEGKPFTTLKFREDVATKLIGKYSSPQRNIPTTSKKTKISSILPAPQPRHSLQRAKNVNDVLFEVKMGLKVELITIATFVMYISVSRINEIALRDITISENLSNVFA